MVERGHGHRLSAQTLARVRVSGQLAWQQLDGDLTIEPWVAGAIHLAHASGPERGQNLIGAEPRAGRKRQRWQTGRILPPFPDFAANDGRDTARRLRVSDFYVRGSMRVPNGPLQREASGSRNAILVPF